MNLPSKQSTSSSLLAKLILWGGLLLILTLANQEAVQFAGVRLTPADLLILILSGLTFLDVFIKDKIKGFITLHKELFFHILFLLFIFISILFSNSIELDKDSLKEFIQFSLYFHLAYVVFQHSLKNETFEKFSLILFNGTISLSILWALKQNYTEGLPAFDIKASFSNNNTYSYFLCLSLPFILMTSIKKKSILQKVLCLFNLIGGFLTIYSGPAMFCLWSGILLVSLFHSKLLSVLSVLILFCLSAFYQNHNGREHREILINSFALYKMPDIGWQSEYGHEKDEVFVDPRYTEWQLSINVLEEYPIFGLGLGHYQQKIGEYIGYLPFPEGPKEPDRNNFYMVLLASTGLTGLCAFILLLLSWFQKAVHLLKQSNSFYATTLLSLLFSFTIINLWSSTIVRGIFPTFVFMICYCLQQCNNPQKTK